MLGMVRVWSHTHTLHSRFTFGTFGEVFGKKKPVADQRAQSDLASKPKCAQFQCNSIYIL